MKGYLKMDNLANWLKMAKHIWFKYRGKNIRLEVVKDTDKRSLKQNAYYWGVVIPTISDTCGYHPDEAHEVLLTLYAPRQEVISQSTGEVTEIITRSSMMNLDEMREYLDRIIIEMAKIDIVIPEAETINQII